MVKKFFIATAVAVASLFTAQAQIGSPRIEAGINISSLSAKDVNFDAKLGYRIAAAYEIGLGPIYVAPGIAYQLNKSGLNITEESKTFSIHALQIPVYAGYKVGFSPLLALSLEAGPYAEFGLSGKSKSTTKGEVEETSEGDIYGKDGLKKANFGLGGSVALHVNKLYVKLGVQYGLSDLNKSSESNVKTSLNAYNLSVGINF